MQLNGAETTQSGTPRGHILLIGGAPGGRRSQLTRPEASLALLATVPSAALLGGDLPVDTVQLADPAEPQALLGYLRTAAAAAGPLLVALVGALTADRRQRELHLALARSRPDNARYTGMPWSWLATELGQRPPGSTTVLADLIADKDAWNALALDGGAALTSGVPVWGQISPPKTAAEGVAAPYTRSLVDLLRRSTGRSTLADLHQLAVSTARLPDRAVVLSSAYTPFAAAAPAAPPAPVFPQAVLRGPALDGPLFAGGMPQQRRTTEELLAASVAACQAGELERAGRLAREAEELAARGSGAHSAPAVTAREARAHLAHLGGAPAAAAELWLTAAEDRLGFQGPDDAEVRAAVDNAHACWARVTDRRTAAQLGPGLLALRRTVPGAGGRGLLAAERRLHQIQQGL
ncbi:hypothetical protein GXW83_18875 [Streptacidiphilus sp. PB12-B1b]|uniref:hypothetical protein n=1 Tax=Streptacidiphilus sp. PB12-B1b TaxID=2705012 RepID=UPI0015FD9C14|nr:hypothetical protein [Streptacidiphilus sp. PB12-B1b]QMU77453.1 hypothetical protein GXW83_18875 [Streptacidiphilus sp. PB12-B1b]